MEHRQYVQLETLLWFHGSMAGPLGFRKQGLTQADLCVAGFALATQARTR